MSQIGLARVLGMIKNYIPVTLWAWRDALLPCRRQKVGRSSAGSAPSGLILRATAAKIRDQLIFAMALGTGLRLAEMVGLDVGDMFAPDGTPRVRVPDGPLTAAFPTPPQASP
jgi:integrase